MTENLVTGGQPIGRQLAVAAGGQLVLLAAVGAGAGLGPVGWAAGLGYLAGLCLLLAGAVRRRRAERPGPGLGPADLVTLTRATLVGGVTALVADGLVAGRGAVPVAVLVGLSTVALLLDAVDGRVARRTGTVSALGARFDMEVDSLLVLVLCIHAVGALGPWTLAVGLMRYAFAAAGRLAPWLRGELPKRYSAKAVAAAQGIVMVLVAADIAPHPVLTALTLAALGALVWSFGHDVRWLWRHADRDAGPAPEPVGTRPFVAGVGTAAAAALVFAALVLPNRIDALTPGAFVRLPIEWVLGAAILLVASARAGRVLATVAGAVLGMLTVLTLLDIAFTAVLDRPFDPVFDWTQAAPLVNLLTDSLTRIGAIAALVAAAALLLGLVVLVALAARRLAGVALRRRVAVSRVAAVLVPLWLVCSVFGAQLVPGLPVASTSASAMAVDRVRQVATGLRDHEEFLAQLANDPFQHVPDQDLLTGLRGKDVVVAFVESYGRTAIDNPEYASVGTTLDQGTAGLGAAGFSARSAYLASSTVGGNSWLAHGTFWSGLWVNNQERHDNLLASDRLTLPAAFARAGARTVAVQPGSTYDSPDAGFYHYQEVYDARNLDYQGPNLGWASTPDQYTLATFQRLERAKPHPPLFAEVVLVSSHAPWPIIPPVLDWDRVGDGSVYNSMTTGEPREAIWAKGNDAVRSAYRRSIEYSLNSLISFTEHYGDDNLVLVVLGDHQPAPLFTGKGANRDVPISIITKDRAVLDRISGWGWTDGLKPQPEAPEWRMDAFRDRFLTAFGPTAAPHPG